MPVWRSGKCDVCYKGHAALLKGFGQLSECLCFDSHCCYLVRFTAFIIPDRLGSRGIQFFLIAASRLCGYSWDSERALTMQIEPSSAAVASV